MQSEKLKNKIYVNLFLILMIFGISYFFTYPIFSGKGSIYKPEKSISSYLEDKNNLNNAISILQDYSNKITEINSLYFNSKNNLPSDLEKILPNKADPVIIVYELTNIAKAPGSNMLLSAPRFADDGNYNSDVNKKYNTIEVSFTLEGSYENIKNFLKDLENSKRMYNVTSLDFSTAQDNRESTINKYSLAVETYYLKTNN